MNNKNIAFDGVYTINASTVVNARMSYGSLQDDYDAPKSAIGEAGLAQFWPNNPWYKSYISEMPAVYYPYQYLGGGGYGMAGTGISIQALVRRRKPAQDDRTAQPENRAAMEGARYRTACIRTRWSSSIIRSTRLTRLSPRTTG